MIWIDIGVSVLVAIGRLGLIPDYIKYLQPLGLPQLLLQKAVFLEKQQNPLKL